MPSKGHESSQGDTCVGIPYPSCLSIRSYVPLLLQTTKLQSELDQSIGCAPDQDFDYLAVQEPTSLTELLDRAWLCSPDYWDLLVLGFFTGCLWVLSLRLPTGA